MATCLKIDDDEGPGRAAFVATLEAAPAAGPDCGEAPYDEDGAPRQNLLHTFSTPVGGMLFVGGLVMIVLPGPSVPLLVVGLALLGREYEWARRALDVVAKRTPERWRRFVTVRGLDVGQGSVRPSDAS